MPRALPIVFDVAVVCVFAAIGRSSHAEALDVGLVLRTAAPFLAATLMAWVLLVRRQDAYSRWVSGAIVWGTTLVLGMIFRAMLGSGVQPSFVVVAALALALGMFGWRGLATLIERRRPNNGTGR